MAEVTALPVLTRKTRQFVAVIEAVGRLEMLHSRQRSILPDEAAGKVDVAHAFERQEHPFSVRARRQHADLTLVGTACPEKREPPQQIAPESGS